MRGRALLFGLNYATTPYILNGCVQDVSNIGKYIAETLNIPTTVRVDDESTRAVRIVQDLYELALQSYKENLEFVWIHYSGHGSRMVDTTMDERDGMDECLVPSDFQTAGLIPDDLITRLFAYFNPKTRILFVCDACHSGTMCDMKYSWKSATKCTVENIVCPIRAKVISLSGCLDDQTSADAFNILSDGKYGGALTSCLLQVLTERPGTRKDAFALLDLLTTKISKLGFSQRPQLCSTFNLALDRIFF
jgi:hypothetical protein